VVDDLNAAVAAVATGDYQHVRSLYPRSLSVVCDCSRAMICAAPGKVLVNADFSSMKAGFWLGLLVKNGNSKHTGALMQHMILAMNLMLSLPVRFFMHSPATSRRNSATPARPAI